MLHPDFPAEHPALQNCDHSEFCEIIYKVGSAVRQNLRNELGHSNLTMAQFGALHCLSNHPDGLTVSELAELNHQVAPTMTGILNRLEERSLIARQRNPADRRNQTVTIAPEGQKVLEEFFCRYHEKMRCLLSRFPEEDRHELIRLLNRLLSVMAES